MSDERCVHDLLPGECGICQPRAGSIDLHSHGRPASGTGYAEEIIDTVYIDDRSYGLVPSAGQAYVFGAGRVLHHRAECSEGGDTPPERIKRIPDPRGDLWRRIVERSEDLSPDPVVNLDGKPVASCCTVCALRPIES